MWPRPSGRSPSIRWPTPWRTFVLRPMRSASPFTRAKDIIVFGNDYDIVIATNDEGLSLLAPEHGAIRTQPAHSLVHFFVSALGLSKINIDFCAHNFSRSRAV